MNSRRQALSWQLLRTVLSIYFTITLVITVSQMAIEFQHTRNMIKHELAGVERTFSPALSRALWELNHEQLEAIQRGLIELPLISAVSIHGATGTDTRTEHPSRSRGGKIEHRFPLYHTLSGEDAFLAEVVFESADNVVFERVKLGYQMLLLNALIKSTALTLLFVWAFRRRLGVPLRELTEAVSGIDLDSLGRKRINLHQNEENELTRLERAFNGMLSTLDAERQAHDATQRSINERLEEQVRDRTQELQAANQRLEEQARTDPLTGIANRRHFVEHTDIEISRLQRNGEPLALLMIDLDHFKRINDTWGHAAGDAVLRNFVVAASTPLRASDLLGRIGGEEFAVLLPNTDLNGAREVAQRILNAIRKQKVSIEDGVIEYTASIGIALLQEGDHQCDPLLSRADSGLYRAKEGGRNRYECGPINGAANGPIPPLQAVVASKE